MTCIFHPLAERELIDAAEFYDRASRGLGSDFLAEIERLTKIVSALPHLGREHEGIRTLSARRFPYSVVYRADADRVFVLAIAHHRRAPRYWVGRLKQAP